jgi:hypothetical protein
MIQNLSKMGRNKGLLLERNVFSLMIKKKIKNQHIRDLPPIIDQKSPQRKSKFMTVKRMASPQMINFKKQITSSRNKILEGKGKHVKYKNINNLVV